MKLIDFDEIFAVYLNEWYAENKDKYEDFGLLEEAAGNVYYDWIERPMDELSGKSVREYFEAIGDPKELVALLVKYVGADMSPPDYLYVRISELPAAQEYLLGIIRHGASAELSVLSVNLLSEMGNTEYLDVLTDWLFSEKTEPELRDIAVEKLTDNLSTCAPKIMERMGKAAVPMEIQASIADILVNYGPDERIYNLLTALFSAEKDKALYASYLGKYGDTRALPILKAFGEQKDINYLEFMETRNAVETLGGTLENDKDFSGDKYYKALKDA